MCRPRSLIALAALLLAPAFPRCWAQWQGGYVLTGTVVTMHDGGDADSELDIIDAGAVVVEGTKLTYVGTSSGLPEASEGFARIDTRGFIYPGLIDLHNHPRWNYSPLWEVPRRYENRDQWRSDDRYRDSIGLLRDQLVANHGNRARDAETHMQVRALVGGTTAVQGSWLIGSDFGPTLTRDIHGQPFNTQDFTTPVRSRVPRLPDPGQEPGDFADVQQKVNDCYAYFCHLSEGVDTYARAEFGFTQSLDAPSPSFVGIHSVALSAVDFQRMADREMSIVWSPLSNLLLYGQTANVVAAKEAGVRIGVGPDWAPSGSKSVLWELKAAYLWSAKHKGAITPQDLVEMVTCDAAEILHWDASPDRSPRTRACLGQVRRGFLADVLVTSKLDPDPYMSLVLCTERHVNLVTVDGEPRYGDYGWMESLKHDEGQDQYELISDEWPKAVDVIHGANTTDFATAIAQLGAAIADVRDSQAATPALTRYLRNAELPDPIYTAQDAEYWRRLMGSQNLRREIDPVSLAAFCLPTGVTKRGAELQVIVPDRGPLLGNSPTLTRDTVIVFQSPAPERADLAKVIALVDMGGRSRAVIALCPQDDVRVTTRPASPIGQEPSRPGTRGRDGAVGPRPQRTRVPVNR